MQPIKENVRAVIKVKYEDPDTGVTEVKESDEFMLAIVDSGGAGYYAYVNNMSDKEIVESIFSLTEVGFEMLSEEGRDTLREGLMHYANSEDDYKHEKEIN